jgi:hypothetical protein
MKNPGFKIKTGIQQCCFLVIFRYLSKGVSPWQVNVNFADRPPMVPAARKVSMVCTSTTTMKSAVFIAEKQHTVTAVFKPRPENMSTATVPINASTAVQSPEERAVRTAPLELTKSRESPVFLTGFSGK